ncbi:MAG TPA: rhodanese-like domain-containing protein, partial [Vicinamibacterales bacterium]|nr:rhodanese-like domain-containing protein [Vicinamibacterales bacterium]
KLAQASYLIGCAKAKEAIVIDANRDVEQYIAAAAAEGAKIRHVTETHIHADYLSGSRELAAKTGATLYLSDEGGPDWLYGFAGDANVVRIKSGHRIDVGNIRVEAVHTPGHTPEHMTFLVTDGAAADEPIGAATGDFIFAGDVGRPDLLERAANIKGTMEVGARQLYASLQKFSSRPDWLQIWPGHGAGSACGKGISAIPHTTLGYERRFNWAFQAKSEREFVESVLAGQPEPPKYFATMKRLNREGPAILGGLKSPAKLDLAAFTSRLGEGAIIVDARPSADYAAGYVPGTINVPLNASFTTYAGWFVPYDRDFFVIVGSKGPGADVAARDLAMIGLDRFAGWFDADVVDAWASATGEPLGRMPQIAARDLAESLKHRAVTLVDVRNQTEWNDTHIDGAQHITLGYLPDHLDEIPRDRPIVVHCAMGGRSSIAASILKSKGFENVINLAGGIGDWIKEGMPTVEEHQKLKT